MHRSAPILFRARRLLALSAALLLAGLAPGAVWAGAEDEAGDRARKREAPPSEVESPPDHEGREGDAEVTRLAGQREPLPRYRPPRRGTPRATVGGGLRGARALPRPTAIAPSHVGQTVAAAPSLFWHIDAVPDGGTRVVFTLTRETAIDPVIETEIALPRRSGLQRVRLSDLGVRLEPEVDYAWSVALVPDPDHRSRDVVTVGYIRRVAEALARRTADVATYADLALWYDAVASVSDAIEARPHEARLHRERRALIDQAGLGSDLLLGGCRGCARPQAGGASDPPPPS